jgi:hypothetical protein
MQPYNINPKTRGVNGYGVNASDSQWAVTFDGSAVASVTVPGDLPMGALGAISNFNPVGSYTSYPTAHNRYIAHFAYGVHTLGDVFVCLNTSAVIPATNNFVQQAGELFPKAWEVKQGDIIYATCSTSGMRMSVWFEQIVD